MGLFRSLAGLFKRAAPLVETTSADEPKPLLMPWPERLVLDWTPATTRAAIYAADAGDFRAASDLCAVIGHDPRVSGVMATRTLGQVSLPLHMEGKGQKAWVAEHWVDMFPPGELARLVWWGLMLGFGVAHLEPTIDPDTGQTLPKMVVWDPRWIRVEHVSLTEPPRWLARTAEGHEVEITPGDGTWVLFTPSGAWMPWRFGLWQTLQLPWLLKIFALYDRAKASETHGSPAYVGTTKGLSEKQRRQFLADLRSMARNARVVLPEGCDLKLLEAAARTWEIYSTAIDWADREMSIAIAGQIVTTEGTPGFSDGDIHNRILSSFIKATAEALTNTIREQVLRPWLPYIFGTTPIPFPSYRTAPPEDVQRKAAGLQSVGQAIAAIDGALAPSGVRIDALTLADRFEIPLLALSPEVAKASGLKLAPTPAAPAAELPAVEPANDVVPMAASMSPRRAGVASLVVRDASGMVWRTSTRHVANEDPPKEFLLFEWGPNVADDGEPAILTKESAEEVIRQRGNRRVPIDLEHLSLDKESKAYDPDPRGWASLEVRDDGLWCVDVVWLDDGERRLRGKLQPYTSPAFWQNDKGEIVKLHNVAIVANPATFNAFQLVAASAKPGDRSMKLRARLLKMLRANGMPVDVTDRTALQHALTLKARAYDATTLASVLKALKMPEDTPANVVRAVLEELAATVVAGADGTAEIADEAAEPAGDEMAAAAEAPPPEEEKPAMASAPAPTPRAADPIAAILADQTARLDRIERTELYAKYPRKLTPALRTALDKLPIASAAEVLHAAPEVLGITPKQPTEHARAATVVPAVDEAAIAEVCRVTGDNPDRLRASMQARAMKGATR